MSAALPRGGFIKLAKFASVGLLNTLLGITIIYCVKWGFHWGDVSANLLGYWICIVLGFVLNGRWTFGREKLNSRHFVGYLSVAGVAYLMNLAAVMLAIKALGVPGDYAQLVGVPVFTLTSFMLNKIYVFSPDERNLANEKI
jgi:putative flippase GtrA